MKHYLRLMFFTLFAVAILAGGDSLHAQANESDSEAFYLLVKDDSFDFSTKAAPDQPLQPVQPGKMLTTFGRKIVRIIADEKTYVLSASTREEANNLKTRVLEIHPEASFEIVDSDKFKSERPELFKEPEPIKKNK